MFSLTVALAAGLGIDSFLGMSLSSDRLVTDGRFETLEECEKAYNELLGGSDEAIAVAPDHAPATTTKAATTVAGEDPTEAPALKGEIGDMAKAEAKPEYHPPRADGTGSDSDGYDYREHGRDWTGECASGSGQSPIDVTKFVDISGQTKSVLWFDYYSDPDLTSDTVASLASNGHGPFFKNGNIDLGYVKIGNDEAEATEYIFHAPSEHTIDGQIYPLELQIMHTTQSGKTLGVAVLFKNGGSNQFLAALKDAVPDLPVWHTEAGAVRQTVRGNVPDAFNLEAVLGGEVHPGDDLTFYNYEGSLTAPPCTGGVEWYVSANAQEASKEQIAYLRSGIRASEATPNGNNREVQDMGGRKVLVGHTGFAHNIKHHGHKADTPPASRGYNSQDQPWKGDSTDDAAVAA